MGFRQHLGARSLDALDLVADEVQELSRGVRAAAPRVGLEPSLDKVVAVPFGEVDEAVRAGVAVVCPAVESMLARAGSPTRTTPSAPRTWCTPTPGRLPRPRRSTRPTPQGGTRWGRGANPPGQSNGPFRWSKSLYSCDDTPSSEGVLAFCGEIEAM